MPKDYVARRPLPRFKRLFKSFEKFQPFKLLNSSLPDVRYLKELAERSMLPSFADDVL
jgi:hypothetical protein